MTGTWKSIDVLWVEAYAVSSEESATSRPPLSLTSFRFWVLTLKYHSFDQRKMVSYHFCRDVLEIAWRAGNLQGITVYFVETQKSKKGFLVGTLGKLQWHPPMPFKNNFFQRKTCLSSNEKPRVPTNKLAWNKFQRNTLYPGNTVFNHL